MGLYPCGFEWMRRGDHTRYTSRMAVTIREAKPTERFLRAFGDDGQAILEIGRTGGRNQQVGCRNRSISCHFDTALPYARRSIIKSAQEPQKSKS